MKVADMKTPISAPKLGSLSQGTLFSCAVAEDYMSCVVFGLVITARCDVAQNKAPVFTYLPVVKLDDWIHRDGRHLLCDRLVKSLRGRMVSALKEAGFSESVLITETPSSILSTLFPSANADKRISKQRNKFGGLVKEGDLLRKCQKSIPTDSIIVDVGDKYVGEKDSLLKELLNNRLNGYYFLSRISEDGPEDGYVVLLREVNSLPRDLADRVASGLQHDEYQAVCRERADFLCRLEFVGTDFCMPEGVLQSPHIEHLMQVFSMLFSRIGLPDPDSSYLGSIWERQPSVGRKRG